MTGRDATARLSRLAFIVSLGVLLVLVPGCASTSGPHTRNGKQRTICTPIVGRKTGEKGWFYPFTPFAGVYTGQRSGMWLFPLFSCEKDNATGRKRGLFLLWGYYWKQKARGAAALFPFFHYTNDGPVNSTELGRYGIDLKCLLITRYRHQSFVDPLGRKSHVRECSVWPLYRYVHRFSPKTTRTIRKRFSVAWRLFRYERTSEGTKVDLLFLPVVRRDNAGIRD